MAVHICASWLSDSNLLLMDNNRQLWIMGDNTNIRTGFGRSEESYYTPIFTGITLQQDETISRFYVFDDLLSFYTNKNRLYVSNPKISKENINPSNTLSYETESESENESESDNEAEYEYYHHEDIPIHYSNRASDEITSDDSENEAEYVVEIMERSNISSTTISNEEYRREIINARHIANKKHGIFQLAESIERVCYLDDNIFFIVDGSIYFFNHNMTDSKIKFSLLGIGCVIIKCNNFDKKYYKLVLPFNPQHIEMNDNYLCMRYEKWYHLFTSDLKWTYFETDLIFKNIVYSEDEYTIYFETDSDYYYYNIEKMKLLSCGWVNSKPIIINTYDKKKDLIIMQDDGLYHHGTKIDMPYHQLMLSVIDVAIIDYIYFCIVNLENRPRIITSKNAIYFNINGIVDYILSADAITYYEDSNIYILTPDELDSSIQGTTEINSYTHCSQKIYHYVYKDLPVPITKVSISESLIIIQSDNQYYYQGTNNDTRCSEFIKIAIPITDTTNLVNKNCIIRSKKIFDEEVSLFVDNNSDKLEKLLNIVELLNNETTFVVTFTDRQKTVSYGDGPKREFFEIAINKFQDIYLVQNNYCHEFNMELLENVSDNMLFNIGSMLHLIIDQTGNSLSIRLPLPFIAEFLKRDLTIDELEYYAQLEDPETYRRVAIYKDNPVKFKELDTNFEDYQTALKYICKYYHYNTTKNDILKLSCRIMRKGFLAYHNIKNLTAMNIPTLDYYISGNHTINRKALLENIELKCKQDMHTTYYSFIKHFINNISEDKLEIFLKNCSGTVCLKRNQKYYINIGNHKGNIFFGTCYYTVNIDKKLFDLADSTIVTELLTTPINYMVDI
jgi:hypothetical protein